MALEFDIRKYKDDGNAIVDGSDALAEKADQVISFQNVRNNQDVLFKAFITAFNETYSPNFNPTEVFGRTDPIYQYKNTTRNITLAFKLPAASESEAFENLGRVQKLLQMLYPSYSQVSELDNALTLSHAPLVRLKVMNLLTKNEKGASTPPSEGQVASEFETTLFTKYKSTSDPGRGLLGVITSCTVNHNLEGTDGVFTKLSNNTVSPNTILPKLIDINLSFSPLHEQTLGYDTDEASQASFALFPYGVELESPDSPPSAGGRLDERRELNQTVEEKRRKAASAQQTSDKSMAKYDRVKRRMDRRESRNGELSAEQQQRLDKIDQQSFEDAAAAVSADQDVAFYENFYGDLIG